MQKRYELRVDGVRAVPFFVGAILLAVLGAGLLLLLVTAGLAAFVVGLAGSMVAGAVLAVRRRLRLGRGAGTPQGTRTELIDAEVERARRRLDLGEGEIIDVEEVNDDEER